MKLPFKIPMKTGDLRGGACPRLGGGGEGEGLELDDAQVGEGL